jgi:hypothetical protein
MRRRREIEILNHASFIDALFLFIGALIFILLIVVMFSRELSLYQFVAPGGERLPDAVAGEKYDVILPIFGGNERYSCTLAAGKLVEGLHAKPTAPYADGTCGIEGTPALATAEPMHLEFLIRENAQGNAAAHTIRRRYDLNVLAPMKPAPLQLLTRALPAAIARNPYQLWFSAVGGAPPYRWEVQGELPQGMTVESQSGLLSGAPPRRAEYPLQLRVSDAAGTSSEWVSMTLSVVVALDPPPLRILTRALPNATAGKYYEVALSATGGISPYSWTASGVLPSGMVCCAGGYLSGTPIAVGRSRIHIAVRSAGDELLSGAAAVGDLDIEVEPPPAVTQPLRMFR